MSRETLFLSAVWTLMSALLLAAVFTLMSPAASADVDSAQIATVVNADPVTVTASAGAGIQPEVDIDAESYIQRAYEAVTGKQYVEAAAAMVMLLLFALTKLWGVFGKIERLKPWLKWGAVGIAVLSAAALAVLSGAGIWGVVTAAVAAVSTGLMAVGTNEVAMKPLAWLFSNKARQEQKAISRAKVAVRDGSLVLGDAGQLVVNGKTVLQ